MNHRPPGELQRLRAGLSGIIAPNPGLMTHWGTNTFLLGERSLAVIDPGPNNPAHLDAILHAAQGADITHILVTHAHLDHSPLAPVLAARTGAPVLAFGSAEAGRAPVMAALAADGLAGGGEGVDISFKPDQTLRDGDKISGENWQIEVLHTPGHFAGHLAFRWNDVVFSGDHVMGWSSSLVSPPDGNLTDFMDTSRRLSTLERVTFYPAHGSALHDPSERLAWLIAHREAREEAILNALAAKPVRIPELTRAVYTDIAPKMLPAAERNVFAHLIDLLDRNLAIATPSLNLDATFQRT